MFPFKDENPIQTRPVVTWALIALNIAVFVFLQDMNDPQSVDAATMAVEWAAIPCEVVTGDGLTESEIVATFEGGQDQACDIDTSGAEEFPDKPVRLAVFFSMFMHAGWMHLLGNVWFLWIFGNNVEDHLGPLRFLGFYLAGGVVATIAHIAVDPDSTIPLVGASGAVAAVMGAYAVWFPNAPIRTLVFFVLWNIKAKWWLGFWLVSQFFIGADSGVAWMAHVGGFVFGLIIGAAIRTSPRSQNRVFTPPYRDLGPWDSTGGAGAGPYPSPHRIRRISGTSAAIIAAQVPEI